MLHFLDLNKRRHRYLNKKTTYRARSEQTQEGHPNRDLTVIQQVVIYFAVLNGVVFSILVQNYKLGQTLSWSTLVPSIPGAFILIIVTFLVVVEIYNRLEIPTGVPFIVQIGFFIQQGTFLHILWSGIGKIFSQLSNFQ